jgi:hypothetical protein
MKTFKLIFIITLWLFFGRFSYAAIVSPIQADYGNVFPTLTEQNVDVYRTVDPAPWYVSFNLLATADVRLGVQALPPDVGVFNPTAIRLVTLDGTNVQFGTDTFSKNPFPDPITQLVVADNLSAGHYALEVSGTGNRTHLTFAGIQDVADFTTRLQVLTPSAVPAPAAVWLFGSALVGLLSIGKSKKII